MSFDETSRRGSRSDVGGRRGDDPVQARSLGPGKLTLTSQLPPVEAAIQRRATGAAVVRGDTDEVHAAAAHGTSGAAGPLPHFEQIQRAFGHHDVSQVQAHVNGTAAEGASAMGAQAFATGQHVAFATPPDLHTAAHEAAHVVQQRGGVSLKGGVGQEGDAHERHADAVADAVVARGSAEQLLDQYGHGAPDTSAAATQHKLAVQLRGNKAVETYQNTVLDGRFTEDHIFKGEVAGNVPKGLHAYTAGTAGENVTVLATLGNTNRVHVIIWTKGAARTAGNAKWSSMFPQDMNKGIATWYINQGPGAVNGEGTDRRTGTGWATINVRYAGDTAYPEGGPDWKSACVYDNVSRRWTYTSGATTYTITNP
jgi:uncharacterized protein DUF4157